MKKPSVDKLLAYIIVGTFAFISGRSVLAKETANPDRSESSISACSGVDVSYLENVPDVMKISAEERGKYFKALRNVDSQVWACLSHQAKCGHHNNDLIYGRSYQERGSKRLAALDQLLTQDSATSSAEKEAIRKLIGGVITVTGAPATAVAEQKISEMPPHMRRFASRMLDSRLDIVDGEAIANAGVAGAAAIHCK